MMNFAKFRRLGGICRNCGHDINVRPEDGTAYCTNTRCRHHVGNLKLGQQINMGPE